MFMLSFSIPDYFCLGACEIISLGCMLFGQNIYCESRFVFGLLTIQERGRNLKAFLSLYTPCKIALNDLLRLNLLNTSVKLEKCVKMVDDKDCLKLLISTNSFYLFQFCVCVLAFS